MTLTRILTTRLSRTWTASPAPGGPAGRYLTHPGVFTSHLARLLLALLEHYGPVADPLLAAAVAGILAGRQWLHRRQHAAFTAACCPALKMPM